MTDPSSIFTGRSPWPARIAVVVLALVVTGAAAQTAATATARPTAPRRVLPAPDPELFDGSKFPPEKRPDRGILADFEAGEGDPQQGAMAEAQGGGGEEGEEGRGGGMAGVGARPAGAPEEQTPEAAEIAGMGGGSEIEGLEVAEAAAGGAPPPGGGIPGDEDLADKPAPIPLGDQSAQIAMKTDSRDPNINRAPAANERSEERMAVRSAAGQQTPNRTRGSERGVDMPSDL
jgi:hypothetical protein